MSSEIFKGQLRDVKSVLRQQAIITLGIGDQVAIDKDGNETVYSSKSPVTLTSQNETDISAAL